MILEAFGKGAALPEPRRVSAAVVLATVVTLAAAIPLGVLAIQARNDTPAVTSEGLVVSTDGGVDQLAGQTLSRGLAPAVQIRGDAFVAASWALYDEAGTVIATGNSVGASPYDVTVNGAGITSLRDGAYDLFVTATFVDGSVVERAARFMIEG